MNYFEKWRNDFTEKWKELEVKINDTMHKFEQGKIPIKKNKDKF